MSAKHGENDKVITLVWSVMKMKQFLYFIDLGQLSELSHFTFPPRRQTFLINKTSKQKTLIKRTEQHSSTFIAAGHPFGNAEIRLRPKSPKIIIIIINKNNLS
jgi:hypothetical protein